MRNLLFIGVSVSTITIFYFLLKVLTSSSIVMLILFTFLGVLGFLIQKKLYNFFMLEFKFIYKKREIQLPNALKMVRDTGMDLAFILILASFGINPILDIIEAKKPSFSITFFYIELAITSCIISLLPTILYCYYYIWKHPSYNKNESS